MLYLICTFAYTNLKKSNKYLDKSKVMKMLINNKKRNNLESNN